MKALQMAVPALFLLSLVATVSYALTEATPEELAAKIAAGRDAGETELTDLLLRQFATTYPGMALPHAEQTPDALPVGAAPSRVSGESNYYTVPPGNETVTGTATFNGPLANAERTYQLLIHDSLLTGLVGKNLTGLAWRLPASSTSPWPATDLVYTHYDVYLSGSVDPVNRSFTFTDNILGPQTRVRYDSLFIASSAYPSGRSPNDWGPEIAFDTTWTYTGGNLLIEIRHTSIGVTGRSNDANSTSTPGYGTAYSGTWTGSYTGTMGAQGNFSIVRLTYESAGLAGTYTIGEGGQFPGLDSAFATLMTEGVAGPVTFSLTDSAYAMPGSPRTGFQPAAANDGPDRVSSFDALIPWGDSPDTISALTLTGPIAGASSTNTITFSSAPGQNVVLRGNGAHLIRLLDASWIRFDGIGTGGTSLTFDNVSTGSGSGILLDGDSDHNIIRNTTIRCSPSSTALVMTIVGTGAPDSNLIEKNFIGRSFNAVFMINGTQPPLGDGNRIMNNTMGGPADTIVQAGVIVQNAANTVIAGNDISTIVRSTSGNVRGISLQTKHLGTQIYGNHVHGLLKWGTATGIVSGINANGAAGDTTHLKVYNNMVFDHDYASSIATGSIVGINVGVGIGDSIAFNSVEIAGSDVSAIVSSALTVGSAPADAGQVWRNNIGVNRRTPSGTGRAIAFLANSATAQFSTNYNDLFVPAQSGSHVGAVTTTNFTTLADWQGAGNDANSVSAMPEFVPPDLHIDSTMATPLSNAGTPLPGFTTDIDGQTRSQTAPDIGADEFQSTVGVSETADLPAQFALQQNFPNPFNPTTRIGFTVPATGRVTLTVYDILGNEVATLLNEEMERGEHAVSFNAAALASGTYFYRLQSGGQITTKKFLLLK